MRKRDTWTGLLAALLVMLLIGSPGGPARAQGDIKPLRVEEAVIGMLAGTETPTVYSFQAYESLRMAVLFDVIAGDMQPTLVVLDQDQSTVLAGATGPNINGLIVAFPKQGTYYLGVSADAGTSATFRLMIHASPPLPVNPFVSQSFLVGGTATICENNVLVGRFATTDELNVCFALDLIDQPITFEAEWWSPSGTVVAGESAALDSSYNGQLLLTGLTYPDTPWEAGWWQVHLLIDGELARIQWVPVVE